MRDDGAMVRLMARARITSILVLALITLAPLSSLHADEEKKSSDVAQRPSIVFTYDVFDSTYSSFKVSQLTEELVLSNGESRRYSHSALATCQTLIDSGLLPQDCIERVSLWDSDQERWIPGVLQSYVPVDYGWEDPKSVVPSTFANQPFFTASELRVLPDESRGLIAGATSGIWRFQGVRHKNGEDFLVTYFTGTPFYNDKADHGDSTSSFHVTPITISGNILKEELDSRLKGYSFHRGNSHCVQVRTQYCIDFYSFDAPLRFRIELILKASAPSFNSQSWLTGYGVLPEVSQRADFPREGLTSVSIAATTATVQVPRIELFEDEEIRSYVDAVFPTPPSTMPEERRRNYLAQRDQTLEQYLKRRLLSTERSVGLGSTYLLEQQESFISPKNTREFSGLQLSTLKSGNLDYATYLTSSNCQAFPRLAGIITSNATAVEPGLPQWDSATSSLVYRVAAPHLKQDGSKNEGFYLLDLDRQVAECFWGRDLKGAKAEVSITGDDGNSQVVAMFFKMGEQRVRFEVSGFHFSASSIKIGLRRDESSSQVSAERPLAKPARSITCRKGKAVKTFTGRAAKCPKGFKRVA